MPRRSGQALRTAPEKDESRTAPQRRSGSRHPRPHTPPCKGGDRAGCSLGSKGRLSGPDDEKCRGLVPSAISGSCTEPSTEWTTPYPRPWTTRPQRDAIGSGPCPVPLLSRAAPPSGRSGRRSWSSSTSSGARPTSPSGWSWRPCRHSSRQGRGSSTAGAIMFVALWARARPATAGHHAQPAGGTTFVAAACCSAATAW